MANKHNKTKIAITVLAVMLALSLCCLAGLFVYNRLAKTANTTVTVPDNLITPDEDVASGTESQIAADSDSTASKSEGLQNSTSSSVSSGESKVQASKVSLYAKHPSDNEAFSFKNMYPGDTVKKNFCVKVAYRGNVTVHYKAKLKSGDEELLQALSLRIKMLSDNSIIYDGPIADMPTSVTYKLFSERDAETELYYEITAYIPTSAGNLYQNKEVVADFEWWAEEHDNLIPIPATGEKATVYLWLAAALFSFSLCVVLIVSRKKGEGDENG